MKKVLLIDSGTGGANILLSCVKEVPYCDYLLFCDNKNLPYGNRSKEELIEITLNNLHRIKIFFDFDIVIFACNTLTATAIEKCREIFADKIFIGTEPAILPALRKFKQEDVCVLATKTTIKNNKLCQKYKNIKYRSIDSLALLIDDNIDDLIVLNSYLINEFSSIKENAIVFGCTHYTSVQPILEPLLPNKVFFSSEEGVAKRLKVVVGEESGENYKIQVITSQDGEFRNKILWYLNEKRPF